jgi:hypothetical protein
MGCAKTLTGMDLDCRESVGGIKEVYILGDRSKVTVTIVKDAITDITLDSGAVSHKFLPYKFRKQTGSMISTINTSEENGTTFVQTDVTLVFHKMEAKKRLEIASLMVGDCAMLVKDGNNKYWYLGLDEPVTLTAGTAGTGTAKGDKNGYDLTLTDLSDTLPYEVSEEIATEIIGTLPVA